MGRASTRRRVLRERRRVAGERARMTYTDAEFGIELKPTRAGMHFGWTLDPQAYLALIALPRVRAALDGLEQQLVLQCRADGISWADIGYALEVSGEGARRKHAEVVEPLVEAAQVVQVVGAGE